MLSNDICSPGRTYRESAKANTEGQGLVDRKTIVNRGVKVNP
jgi:hypothetical protein